MHRQLSKVKCNVYYKSIFFNKNNVFKRFCKKLSLFLLDFGSGQQTIISYEAGFDQVTVLKV